MKLAYFLENGPLYYRRREEKHILILHDLLTAPSHPTRVIARSRKNWKEIKPSLSDDWL
jgi:hypothetical protein